MGNPWCRTVACFLGGIGAFLAGAAVGPWQLGKIHWLHLTPKRLKWPERFFSNVMAPRRYLSPGSSFCFRPSWRICWPACQKCHGALFCFYNVTGSAAYSITYILIGYFFGKKWKLLVAWLGPTALYLIFAGLVIVVLA